MTRSRVLQPIGAGKSEIFVDQSQTKANENLIYPRLLFIWNCNHPFQTWPFWSSVPSEPPPNTVITVTSSRSIRVSWKPINAPYVHGILLGYEVWFAKDDGSTLTWISKRLGPEIHHILLDELAPNTWNGVVICARTSKGCGKEYFDLVQSWEDGEFSFWRHWKRCQDVARVSMVIFEEQIKLLISLTLSLPSCLNRYFDSNSFFFFFFFWGGGATFY